MLKILLSVCLTIFSGGFSYAAEGVPLKCPECGTWDINLANPSVLIGEKINVEAEKVIIPYCGEFQYSIKEKNVTETDNRRSYKTTLRLKQTGFDLFCDDSDIGEYRLNFEVSTGYNKDGGFVEFRILKGESDHPLIEGSAWNFERDNPCDSGSGFGSAACLKISNAKLFKALALEVANAYSATREAKGNANFNSARFYANTLDFCLKRESESGGGSWR